MSIPFITRSPIVVQKNFLAILLHLFLFGWKHFLYEIKYKLFWIWCKKVGELFARKCQYMAKACVDIPIQSDRNRLRQSSVSTLLLNNYIKNFFLKNLKNMVTKTRRDLNSLKCIKILQKANRKIFVKNCKMWWRVELMNKILQYIVLKRQEMPGFPICKSKVSIGKVLDQY